MVDGLTRLLRPISSLTHQSRLKISRHSGRVMSVNNINKRPNESEESDEPVKRNPRPDSNVEANKFLHLKHGKGRSIPRNVIGKLTEHDVALLEEVKTSCNDLKKIREAIQLRIKHRLCVRLPEDLNDSTYYIENGLRKVYPYEYLYQSYAKRRWLGRKLKDVIKEEFRDISDDQLKLRFDSSRILINGLPAKFDHILKDNDFITNMTHRHELPVLAAPIKIIHQDKDMLVIDKPPSVPIHPCGRYRHNSIVHILNKEYNRETVKIVHRLDRLVSGVLLIALNSAKAHALEVMIKNRHVQKVYVCRVAGEFPLGNSEDDGEITVDQPLDTVPGKIGITVVVPDGKPSVTKFKRLSFNGKTSAVLCKPLTGRMHQIRVHLQYLGHPIVNDTLYNTDAFGPERGKGARYGKSFKQITTDILATHRASTWLMLDDADEIYTRSTDERSWTALKTERFIDDDEKKETLAALDHFYTDSSWKDMQQKCKFDEAKVDIDPSCRDCIDKFHDPPLRSLFLYLHALKYSGDDWSYESEMPAWAKESWEY